MRCVSCTVLHTIDVLEVGYISLSRRLVQQVVSNIIYLTDQMSAGEFAQKNVVINKTEVDSEIS